MMREELEMLVGQYCNDLQNDWENRCPESLSKKVTFLVDHHPYNLRDSLLDYVDSMGYDASDVDIMDAAQPYREEWKDLAYHILGQYSIKRNG